MSTQRETTANAVSRLRDEAADLYSALIHDQADEQRRDFAKVIWYVMTWGYFDTACFLLDQIVCHARWLLSTDPSERPAGAGWAGPSRPEQRVYENRCTAGNLPYPKWLRHTHHADGSFREDMRSAWEDLDPHGLIHHLHPSKPMTIIEIMRDIFRYAADFYPECDLPTEPEVLALLDQLVAADMVERIDHEQATR